MIENKERRVGFFGGVGGGKLKKVEGLKKEIMFGL